MSFEKKKKLKLFKNLTNFAQRYDTRQAYPYGWTALYQIDVQFGDKSIPFKMVKCITRKF